MAVPLIPYQQDESKWEKHYMKQAMKQLRPREFTTPLRERTVVRPSIVLQTSQLVEQAKSEMKREKHNQEVYAPVKIPLQSDPESSSASTSKQSTRKRKAAPAKGTKSKKQNRKKDVFD